MQMDQRWRRCAAVQAVSVMWGALFFGLLVCCFLLLLANHSDEGRWPACCKARPYLECAKLFRAALSACGRTWWPFFVIFWPHTNTLPVAMKPWMTFLVYCGASSQHTSSSRLRLCATVGNVDVHAWRRQCTAGTVATANSAAAPEASTRKGGVQHAHRGADVCVTLPWNGLPHSHKSASHLAGRPGGSRGSMLWCSLHSACACCRGTAS